MITNHCIIEVVCLGQVLKDIEFVQLEVVLIMHYNKECLTLAKDLKHHFYRK